MNYPTKIRRNEQEKIFEQKNMERKKKKIAVEFQLFLELSQYTLLKKCH